MNMFAFKLSSQLVKVPVFAPVSVNVTAWSAVAISEVAQIPELHPTLWSPLSWKCRTDVPVPAANSGPFTSIYITAPSLNPKVDDDVNMS
jgi:hypothetical protein